MAPPGADVNGPRRAGLTVSDGVDDAFRVATVLRRADLVQVAQRSMAGREQPPDRLVVVARQGPFRVQDARGLVNLWYGGKKKLSGVSIGQVWKPE